MEPSSMSESLISRSPDLSRLQNEGYEVEVNGGYLLIHGVPYVNSQREVCRGILASVLPDAGGKAGVPTDHTVLFAGGFPCHQDGREIAAIKHGESQAVIKPGISASFSFSNSTGVADPDFYSKMMRYIRIISDPAAAVDETATAATFKLIAAGDQSPFRYADTSSSRAGIRAMTDKLQGQKIAIVGVGGTGSFVLDFVAKTTVAEIRIIDGDLFLQHNAFRAPGAAPDAVLQSNARKVDYLAGVYSAMRNGIVPHAVYMNESNLDLLQGSDFVFICIDRGAPKRLIIDYLYEHGTPFIDVGLGIERDDEAACLSGVLRVTAGTPQQRDHIALRIPFDDEGNEDYARNIQIVELNALNASLAVIKWKKMQGVYADSEQEMNSTYVIRTNSLIGDENISSAQNHPEA